MQQQKIAQNIFVIKYFSKYMYANLIYTKVFLVIFVENILINV